MSQSENIASHSDAVNKVEEQSESPSFTLQVVSPSVGVSSPLSFQRLPATTTIKQLKARIRDALPSNPTDESQRLIHRGRMLAREAETMLEIFGQETVRLGILEFRLYTNQCLLARRHRGPNSSPCPTTYSCRKHDCSNSSCSSCCPTT